MTLLNVLRAWSHEDDWSVPSVYVDAIEEFAMDLAAGDDAGTLARHAKHFGDAECAEAQCPDRIPHHWSANDGWRIM
jgi:hypothetical protein